MSPGTPEKEIRYTHTIITERILEMVRSGELKAGDRLPSERKFAQYFGVSRGTLRQAYQILAVQRVLDGRQGDGTYILDSVNTAFHGNAIVKAINQQRHFVHEIFEFRRMVEPQIAALAAERIRPLTLSHLKDLVSDQQNAATTGKSGADVDAEFHRVLAQSAGNKVIDQVMSVIQTIIDECRTVWLQSSERRQASIEGHLRIIDALEARDAEGAMLAMKNHIIEIERHIFGEQGKTNTNSTNLENEPLPLEGVGVEK